MARTTDISFTEWLRRNPGMNDQGSSSSSQDVALQGLLNTIANNSIASQAYGIPTNTGSRGPVDTSGLLSMSEAQANAITQQRMADRGMTGASRLEDTTGIWADIFGGMGRTDLLETQGELLQRIAEIAAEGRPVAPEDLELATLSREDAEAFIDAINTYNQGLEDDVVLGDPGDINEDTTRSFIETVFDEEGNITTIIDPTLVTFPPLIGTIDTGPEGGSGGGQQTSDTSQEESGARQDSVTSSPVQGDQSLEGDLTRQPGEFEPGDDDIVGRQIAGLILTDSTLTDEQRNQIIRDWEDYSGRQWNPDWTSTDDIYGPAPQEQEITDQDITDILNAPPQAGAPFIIVRADGTVVDANTGEPIDYQIPGADEYGRPMPGVYDDSGNRIGNVPAGSGGQEQDLPTSTGGGRSSFPPIVLNPGSGTSTSGQNQAGGGTDTSGGGGNQNQSPPVDPNASGNQQTGGSDTGAQAGQTGAAGAGTDPGTGTAGSGGGPGDEEGDDGVEKEKKKLFDDFKFRPTMANVSFQDPGMPGVIGGTPQRQSILGMFREYL